MASRNNQEGSSEKKKGSSSSSVAKNVATVSSVDGQGFLAAFAKSLDIVSSVDGEEFLAICPFPEMRSKLKDNLISSNNSTSKNWTPEEDNLLQDLLIKYPREAKDVDRYTKISNDLKTKSFFDVAGRVMWLNSEKELRGKEAEEPTESSGSKSPRSDHD